MGESLLCAPLVIMRAREAVPLESIRLCAPGARGCHRARHVQAPNLAECVLFHDPCRLRRL